MTVDFVLHDTVGTPEYGEDFFRRITDAAAPYLKIPEGYTGEVGISLIDEDEMRKLNREHRKIDASTDVLSFPLHIAPITGYTSLSLGDLFISPSDVVRKSHEHGRTEREQMAWTVVHGLLHLAGYDHERSEADADKMFAIEQTILNQIE